MLVGIELKLQTVVCHYLFHANTR